MFKKLLAFVLPTVIVTGVVIAGPYAGGPYVNSVPSVTDITGLASGIATWLGTPSSANLRAAITDESGTGAALFQSGDLGTPTAGVLTNATGLPISSGVSGLGANVATFLATPSSANLRSALTDESGTGVAYFQGGDIGTPSAGVLTNATGLPISTGLTDSAYTTYTPTLSCTVGTLTSATASGRYKTIGKTVFISIEVVITTNGSCATALIATLPGTMSVQANNLYNIAGRSGATGKMLSGVLGTGSPGTVALRVYDNTYPGADGVTLRISGTFEQP